MRGNFTFFHLLQIILVQASLLLSSGLQCHDYLTNYMVPEPEGSSPHSQQPATGPYPAPVESTPEPPANLKIHSDPIFPSMLRSSEWYLPSSCLFLTSALDGRSDSRPWLLFTHGKYLTFSSSYFL